MRLLLLALAVVCSGCGVDSTESEEGGGGATEGGGASGGGGANANGGAGEGGFTAGSGGLGAGGLGVGGEAGGLPEGEPCVANGQAGVCVDVSECTVPGYAPVPGFCPGPAEIQCCALQAEGSCDPEAMPLPNANLADSPGLNGCPEGMHLVEAICVDTFEAHLVTFPDLQPVSPYFNPGNAEVMAVSKAQAVPQGYINQLQAADACTNAGKRLCSNQEWLRACRGPEANIYPYGDALELGVCNDHRDQHPAVQYFMSSEDWIWSELDHPCLNQLADGLALSGEFDGCVSSEGARDMMGNLHEWTSDPAGTFRGGFYVDTVINGSGCLYATTAHDVSHWDYSTGFRCCMDL